MFCRTLENLNSWSPNTNKLMDLVMKATHLINKDLRKQWGMLMMVLGTGSQIQDYCCSILEEKKPVP